MGTRGWAVLWQKARACPAAPAREQGRLGGGQDSSSPGHQAPPWGWDVSPRVGVGSVEPMAGPGRAAVEQETDFCGIAGTWNSLKWGPGP